MSFKNILTNLKPATLIDVVNTVVGEPEILTDVFPEKKNLNAASGMAGGYTARIVRYDDLSRLASPGSRGADSIEVNINDMTSKLVDLLSTKEHFPLTSDEIDILKHLPKPGTIAFQGQAEAINQIAMRIKNRVIALRNWMRAQILYNDGVIANVSGAPLKFSIDYQTLAALRNTVAADGTYDWLTGSAPVPYTDLSNLIQEMKNQGQVATDIYSDSAALMRFIEVTGGSHSVMSQKKIEMLEIENVLVLPGKKLKWHIIDEAYVNASGTVTPYASTTKIAVVANPPAAPAGRTELGRPAVIEQPEGNVGLHTWSEVKENSKVNIHVANCSLAILANPKSVGVLTWT